QKTTLSKRTIAILAAVGGVVVAGGLYVYFGVMATPAAELAPVVLTNQTPEPKVKDIAINASLFADPQFLSLQRQALGSFADQQSAVATSQTEPLPVAQVWVTDPQTGGQLVVSWQLPAVVNFGAVRVYRSQGGTSFSEAASVYEAAVTTADAGRAMSYVDPKVDNNILYSYWVLTEIAETADHPAYLSAASTAAVRQPVAAIATDTVPPEPPAQVQVVPQSDGTIEVSWVNTTDTDLALVHVYRSTVRGELGTRVYGANLGDIGATRDGSATRYFTDGSGLSNGFGTNTVYYYTVTSRDRSGNESSVNIIGAPQKSPTYNPFQPVTF
ncbi:MAG: hypothetical protein V1916_01825, partial [Patescibacteria group bacterium]